MTAPGPDALEGRLPPVVVDNVVVGGAEPEVGRAVYERIEALMDAKAGTSEGAELAYLADLVSSVEEYGSYSGPPPAASNDGVLAELVGILRKRANQHKADAKHAASLVAAASQNGKAASYYHAAELVEAAMGRVG